MSVLVTSCSGGVSGYASSNLTTNISNGSTSVANNRGAMLDVAGNVISDLDRVSMKELDGPVFRASIDDLINLWVTRYGNEWVDLVDIEQEPFYLLVYKRLRQTGELEQHYLTDRSRFVCRKPE